MDSGVYRIRCGPTGKSYVGSSSSLRMRKKQHFSDLRCHRHDNPHLQRAFDKWGEAAFEWEVLEETADNLLVREKVWIESLDTLDNQKGYNIVSNPVSPMKGRKHSQRLRLGLADQASATHRQGLVRNRS